MYMCILFPFYNIYLGGMIHEDYWANWWDELGEYVRVL